MPQPASNPPPWEVIEKKGVWQLRHIEPYSDGDARHWPPQPYRSSSEEQYLIKLAKAWSEKDGFEQPGISYYLDALPKGFALFEVDQPGGSQVYKRLFGHTSGKYYDSILRFQPHFLWLMAGMSGTCECIHCGHYRPAPALPRMRNASENAFLAVERPPMVSRFESGASSRSNSTNRMPGTTSTRPQRQIRSAGAPYARDAEGTEDVYKEVLKRLEASKGGKKGVKDDIREANSFDWRAQHNDDDGHGEDLVQRALTLIEHQHTFVPRVGELVLFCPNFLDGHYLMLDEEKQEYKFYSFDQRCFPGFPAWRGGLVAAVPSATATDGPIDFPDIQDPLDKSVSLSTGGFRVETFPDPNNESDKSASKQYRYVALRNIRPLSHWKMLLRGLPRQKWHPSIEYALTCMTSISLLEKTYFKGDWPHADVRCKGVYIGAELITIGDAVRIVPPESPAPRPPRKCTDVLVVDSIRLHLIDIKPDHVLPDSPLLSSKSAITLVGRAYTIDMHRHYQLRALSEGSSGRSADVVGVPPEEVKTTFRPVGSGIYGTWYPLHPPNKRYEISYDQVLGRLYEASAVQIWTGKLQRSSARRQSIDTQPSLDFDREGVEEGRAYSTQADARLKEPSGSEFTWFWADTRAEALDIATINGVDVGKYDGIRDPGTLELWRSKLRILSGQQPPVDTISSQYRYDLFEDPDNTVIKRGRPVGRPVGSKLVNGKLIKPGDLGYEDAVGRLQHKVHATPTKHRSSQMAGAALASTDEEDDEEEEFEDAEEDWGPEQGASRLAVQEASPSPKAKQLKSKAEFMAGAVDDDFSGDTDVGD